MENEISTKYKKKKQSKFYLLDQHSFFLEQLIFIYYYNCAKYALNVGKQLNAF